MRCDAMQVTQFPVASRLAKLLGRLEIILPARQFFHQELCRQDLRGVFNAHEDTLRTLYQFYASVTMLQLPPAKQRLEMTVEPTPATHAISTHLKAGDTVHEAGELPKTHENTRRIS